MALVRYLYLCCYLAVPFVTVTLPDSSQTHLIFFLAQLPSSSYALFCPSEVPHLLSHTKSNDLLVKSLNRLSARDLTLLQTFLHDCQKDRQSSMVF